MVPLRTLRTNRLTDVPAKDAMVPLRTLRTNRLMTNIQIIILVQFKIEVLIRINFDEWMDETVFELIHPPVQAGGVAAFPGALHDGRFGQVLHLGDDVEFDEAVEAHGFVFNAA